MKRTIHLHKPSEEEFALAVVDAYEWVTNQGGTLIFGSKQLMRQAQELLYKRLGKQRVIDDSKAGKLHVGVSYGQNYVLYGPLVAIIDGTDLDMSRLEQILGDEDNDWVTELRSYTKKPESLDTHEKWTHTYHPESVN